MRAKTVIQEIAACLQARANCEAAGNAEWFDRWSDRLAELEREWLPSGSGIDSGTKIDHERSRGNRIVLLTSFHHMHESGMYDGWTEHTIIVRPAFDGLDIAIGGRNRNDIKEYLHEVFDHELSTRIRFDTAAKNCAGAYVRAEEESCAHQ